MPVEYLGAILVVSGFASIALIVALKKRKKSNKRYKDTVKPSEKTGRKSPKRGSSLQRAERQPGQHPLSPYIRTALEYKACSMDLTMEMLRTVVKMNNAARRQKQYQYSREDQYWQEE